jgi:hypothetical protein
MAAIQPNEVGPDGRDSYTSDVVEDGRSGVPNGSRDGRVWTHAPTTAYVESPERVVVLDLSRLDLPPYVFEGSASQVWACLDGDRTEAEVVSDLAEAFDVPTDVVEPDVTQFVDRLVELGLVVGAGDGNPT